MSLIIKGRLKLLADKVPACKVAADIGTDHAYIPIYLIQQHICKKAIASDVRSGPINAADKNIGMYNMKDSIETRLGSGLATLAENEAEVIIIAGMGGRLVTELLEADIRKAWSASALILQPMNDLDVVRKWLFDHGFDIYDEEMTAEDSKYYCVISAKYDGKVRSYKDFELQVGEKLVEKRDPLLKPYCEMKVSQINKVLKQLTQMEDNSQLKDYYSELRDNYLQLTEGQ